MANYAFLDENNIVTEVIFGIDETELIEGKNPETWYGEFRGQKCVRTSYNSNIRKNFAGVGYVYNEELDAFIPPKPFDSWILNESKYDWDPPVEYPDDGKPYSWNEELQVWKLFKMPQPFPSWSFDEDSYRWTAPVEKPQGKYFWNEAELAWNEIVLPTES